MFRHTGIIANHRLASLEDTSSLNFSPISIPGCVSWLAANLLPVVADNTQITNWLDYSGLGINATQPTPTYKANYRNNIVNGQPVLRFDGVDDHFLLPYVCTPAFSFSVVTKFSTLGGGYAGILTGRTSTGERFTLLLKSNGKTAAYINYVGGARSYDGTGAATHNTTAFCVITCVVQANTFSTWKDGVLDATVTFTDTMATAGTSAELRINGSQDYPGRYYPGDTAEVVYYNTALATPDRKALEQWLGAKYAIPIAP